MQRMGDVHNQYPCLRFHLLLTGAHSQASRKSFVLIAAIDHKHSGYFGAAFHQIIREGVRV